MAFAANYRRVVESVFVVVLSMVMIWFGNGFDPLWPLMWIALAPVLMLPSAVRGGLRRPRLRLRCCWAT
jgi:hypothetical protein